MRKAVLLAAALLFSAPVFAADATPAPAFTDAQKSEIESIIKDYLVNQHPEVMAEGLQNLQHKEQADAEAKSKSEVNNARDRVYNDPHSPAVGNLKGDLTLVEFFDYSCGYCKMSEEPLEKLIKEDKGLKVIYKDFPILGPVSVEAAKAGLASVKQGKFEAFHNALMSKKDHPTSEMIYATAKDVGLDVEKLKKDMTDSSVLDEINANLKLGQDIGVRGTPMFIIGDNIYPGALQYDQMKQAVTEARAKK